MKNYEKKNINDLLKHLLAKSEIVCQYFMTINVLFCFSLN